MFTGERPSEDSKRLITKASLGKVIKDKGKYTRTSTPKSTTGRTGGY